MGGKRTLAGIPVTQARLAKWSDFERMEEVYRKLRHSWAAGERDRESAVHLLFLSWMHWADPPFVTGMSDDPGALELWHEIFEYFGGEASSDAEFLHVAGMMAGIFPWMLGDERSWEATSRRMKVRSRQLRPDGFSSGMFEGRGDYGEYFAHQARQN